MTRWLVVAAVVVFGVVGLAGCGSSGSGSASPRPPKPAATPSGAGTPITDAQALTLSKVLESNYERGGAKVEGATTVQGKELDYAALLDFRGNRGKLVIRERDLASAAPRGYFFTSKYVLAQAGVNSKKFLVQAPNPQQDPVHHLIQLLQLLSARSIDNIQLIQSQDVRFLGRKGKYDVYRYGKDGHTTYSIDPGSGLLAAVQADDVSGTKTTVRLLSHRRPRVVLPAARNRVSG